MILLQFSAVNAGGMLKENSRESDLQ